MEIQMTMKSQSNHEKEKRSWRNQAPWLRLYYKPTVIKKYDASTKSEILVSRTGNKAQRQTPCTYGHLIYDKEARIYDVEKTASSISGTGETGRVKEWN